MSEDTRRVLDLLAQGKVTIDQADQLLQALHDQPRADAATRAAAGTTTETAGGTPPTTDPRFIRISVHKPAYGGRGDKDVQVRVPIGIVKGGMRLGALIPGIAADKIATRLRERGLDVDFTKGDADAIVAALRDLGELSIDVDGGKQVRITCE